MRLVLDFASARRTAGDDIVGVVARVGDAVHRILISANHVETDEGSQEGVPVARPDVCTHQAWLAAVHVSGNRHATPIGDGEWNEAARTLVWSLRSGQRRTMA